MTRSKGINHERRVEHPGPPFGETLLLLFSLSLSLQQVGAPVPLLPPRTLDHEGVKQGYTSPGGLFIPPVAVEEQRRHYQSPQQIIQKPRSQAIPIVPPKVCMVA